MNQGAQLLMQSLGEAGLDLRSNIGELRGIAKNVSTANSEEINALAAGINIKISGNSLLASELISYKQSIETGARVEYGTVVTVSFKSNTGISDDEG